MCRNVGADMFGLEYGRQCMCGDSRDVELSEYEGSCGTPCTGDASVTCGGCEITALAVQQ